MLTIAQTMRAGISFFVIWSASCTLLFAAPCPEHITREVWLKTFQGGKQAQDDFLEQIKVCLPGRKKMQQEVDDLAVDSFEVLGTMEKNNRKSFVDFSIQVLLINAECGFPSSQHNYATIHNAEPGTLLQLLVPQDYNTFLYWTRKAAAQKEPRALFNLAIRMTDDAPSIGVVYDLPAAYTILTFLDRTDLGLPPPVMAYISKTKGKVSKKLGPDRTRQLEANLATFDFSALALAARTQ